MAPVLLKQIISVSSEDRQNPASNLLKPALGGKWLCAPDNRSRTANVVIELSKRVRISSLEVCNFGSAFVEVLVSDSESPEKFITLMHMCMLMSLPEARAGRNKTKAVTYGREKLSASAVSKKWDRIKIHCVQKYNLEAQFGLRSISLFSQSALTDEQRIVPSLFSPQRVNHILPSPTSQKLQESMRQKEGHHNHKLPSSPDPLLSSKSNTTKRYPSTLKQSSRSKNTKIDGSSSEKEDFEFSGIEKQSRLFRGCMQGKPEDLEASSGKKRSNKILNKIAEEKEKYRERSYMYPKKKVLKKELPKAELMRDFVESYKESKDKSGVSGLNGACRIMSSHDNDYEIGEEPENTWGWNKFKGKPRKRGKPATSHTGGWISKRKNLQGMIAQCSTMFKKAGYGEIVTPDVEPLPAFSEEDDVAGHATDHDSDTTIIYSPDPSPDKKPPVEVITLVECPLCSSFFPQYAIQVHASTCSSS